MNADKEKKISTKDSKENNYQKEKEKTWIPAFAGMTNGRWSGNRGGNDRRVMEWYMSDMNGIDR